MADNNLEVEIEDQDLIDSNDETGENIDETPNNANEGEGKDNKEESEEEEEKSDATINAGISNYKDVVKKYPTLFKDFPQLRHDFFHAKEYRQVFPSIEDAKEAAQANETLNEFTSSITSGNVNDLSGTIKAIGELSGDAIPNLARNFLPALQKVDPDIYYEAITPTLVSFIRALYDNGIKHGNNNLKNAGILAAMHFFDDEKVATGERKVASTLPEKNKDSEVNKEREQFQHERYTTFLNDVVQDSTGQLMTAIKTGIDPGGKMTEAMKDMIAEKVQKEIDRVLKSDPAYSSQMNSLWKKAGKENFVSSHKSRIITTYLGRAKEILPSIRAKIRSQVLGTRNVSTQNNNRREPNNNVGGGSHQKTSDFTKIDKSKIDWSKTSDTDYINGRITYKEGVK